jgi:chromosome segregation ATPase
LRARLDRRTAGTGRDRIHELPTINNQQSTINNQQSTINNQQSTINNRQSTIDNQQSTIDNRQSTINNRQSTIDNQQSTGKPVALGRTPHEGNEHPLTREMSIPSRGK